MTGRREKQKPIDRLMWAMDRCAMSRGEGMYTMGYRAAKGEPEESHLYAKMMRQFAVNDRDDKAFRRLALKLLREAAQAPRQTSKSRRRPSGRDGE